MPKYTPNRGHRANSAGQARASGVIAMSQNHIARVLDWIMRTPIRLLLLKIRLYGDTDNILILTILLYNHDYYYACSTHILFTVAASQSK